MFAAADDRPLRALETNSSARLEKLTHNSAPAPPPAFQLRWTDRANSGSAAVFPSLHPASRNRKADVRNIEIAPERTRDNQQIPEPRRLPAQYGERSDC